MSDFEQAREAFRLRWGFDPAPVIESAFRRGEFDLEGGTEDERAFIREVLTAGHITCGHITADMIADGSESIEKAIREGAPMTGPGGRWHPVSELFERDAEDAGMSGGGDVDGEPGEAVVMRVALHPAGGCAHCGLPIEESHLFEFRPRELFATDRPLTILIHTGSGHERCDGRDTTAERGEPEEGR